MTKHFSQACENNKAVIIKHLIAELSQQRKCLEIGSGSGQHAVHFAPLLGHLLWQTSDLLANHASINAWLSDYPAPNLLAPIEFFVGQSDWPSTDIDAVFSANTAHIMQPKEVKVMMSMISANLPVGGVFCQYGPFKVDGDYTSDSNRAFDTHLYNQGCGGIRDISELQQWAPNLILCKTVPMPANNFLLVWSKLA